jgi:hypothetical protein
VQHIACDSVKEKHLRAAARLRSDEHAVPVNRHAAGKKVVDAGRVAKRVPELARDGIEQVDSAAGKIAWRRRTNEQVITADGDAAAEKIVDRNIGIVERVQFSLR